MEHVLDVAAYVCGRFYETTGKRIDEMKLHKLLYLSQREMLSVTDEPLFEESLEGWKYGPVSPLVRGHFDDGAINAKTGEISDPARYIVNNVLDEYADIPAVELSAMTHKEVSWINAREGLRPNENGCRALSVDDIRKDAEKVRSYDHIWDMYVDEFDDAEDFTA